MHLIRCPTLTLVFFPSLYGDISFTLPVLLSPCCHLSDPSSPSFSSRPHTLSYTSMSPVSIRRTSAAPHPPCTLAPPALVCALCGRFFLHSTHAASAARTTLTPPRCWVRRRRQHGQARATEKHAL
ncbi:hypothetical protein B0H10DRAFT_1326992 [Mycena sp. CBHHK59/15]|nr:hypothetical protein B0H10DRAFT_1326992 [Mycena sp. CBHHK59/15]